MDYSRWMSLNTKIHGKKLANICLPMTHDSGTFDLSDDLAPEEKLLPELQKAIDEIVDILNGSGLLPYGEDPLYWMMKDIIKSLKGLTTATHQNIAKQLSMGVRGFDFRICNVKGTFYIHHGLQSTSTFESMLDDIAAFMKQTTNATKAAGEIVYVNMSHYAAFDAEAYENFAALVKQKLGDWAYLNTGTNDPFNATYKEIIGQDGTNKSRVILVSEDDLGDSKYFWPANYCPPDDGRNQDVLVGKYTDSTDVDHVTKTQVKQFQSAIGQQLPFVNYMTLTPSTTNYVNIILSSLYPAFNTLAEDLSEHGMENLAAVAEGIALILEADVIATELLGFRTLEELAMRIDKDLPDIVDGNFVPLTGKDNKISMIFCDFYEMSQLVDLSIALSNDLEVVWSGNTKIKVDTSEPKSDEGPTAVMYQGLLHMLYTGRSPADIWMAIYDPKQGKWTSNKRINEMKGGKFDPRSNKSPAVAVYNDILYMVFKGEKGNEIRSASWNGIEWGGGDKIKIESGGNVETDNSPYLAVYNGEMHLVNKASGKDDILWSRFKDGKWTGGSTFKVTDNSKHPYPTTNKRPALVAYSGKLYLYFKGSHSNNLRECTWDGTDWTGNVDIKDRAEKYHPKSNEGPGVARFAGEVYLLYKGEIHDDIYQSIYNGVDWFEDVELKKVTPISPASNRSPWVVRSGVELFLLNKGDGGNIYQSTLRPVHFS